MPPTYRTQNECNTYRLMGVDHPTIDKVKKKFQSVFGISLPLIKNLWPLKSRVTVVVGAPLAVPKVANPPDALVQEYLLKYIDALTEACDEHAWPALTIAAVRGKPREVQRAQDQAAADRPLVACVRAKQCFHITAGG